MKHIRTFEGHRNKASRTKLIKEAVLQVNDIFKVKTMVDIPQSLINAYVKKVKEFTQNDPKTFFGDVDIAEEIVKYVLMTGVNIDNLPANVLMGGQEEAEDTQLQGQAQLQDETQLQTEVQDEVQVDVQGETQFEDPQAQGQAQAQTQGQAQAQEEEEEEEEDDFGLQDDSEDLPL